MIVDPVQRSVTVEHVHQPRGTPRRDIRFDKVRLRMIGTRLGQHLGRTVDAGQVRLRPALLEQRREIAGAAP